MSEWVMHDGWSDPKVSGDTLVEVRYRDGRIDKGVMHDWDQAWQWNGSEEGETSGGAIVEYRVIPNL